LGGYEPLKEQLRGKYFIYLWVLPWDKTYTLIDCLRLNPKEAFFGVIIFIVVFDLRSLKILFRITNLLPSISGGHMGFRLPYTFTS